MENTRAEADGPLDAQEDKNVEGCWSGGIVAGWTWGGTAQRGRPSLRHSSARHPQAPAPAPWPQLPDPRSPAFAEQGVMG